MNDDASDIISIIQRIDESPARARLDLSLMRAILRYASAGGGPIPPSAGILRIALPRLRRYVIFLDDLNLLTIVPERPEAGECYPRVVGITGITPSGTALLAYFDRVLTQPSNA